MTTQPQADVHPELISDQTKRTLRDFVRDVVSHLSDALKESAAEFEEETRWERGSDGHFRERKKRIRRLWRMLSDEWLRSLPNYQTCVECLKSDVVVGPHLDCLIGTHLSSFRLKENYILMSLIDAMLDDEGHLGFTDARFQRKWREWVGFFGADRIAYKMVSPLPYLVVPAFPLRLNDELVLDRLTDDEMTRCCRVGVILPHPLQPPFIPGEAAVGIRRSMLLPKLIGRGNEPHEPPEVEDEGGFGHRPLFRDDLVIDDVLSALRLFKHGRIRSTGNVSWTDFPAPGGSFRGLGWWPYVRKFELSEGEVPHFLELWRLLEEKVAGSGSVSTASISPSIADFSPTE